MEKILLNFDQVEYNNRAGKLRNASSACQQLVDKINAINSFKLTNAQLFDILQSHGDQAAKGIEKAIESELKQARIESASILAAAIKGDIEKYYAIVNAFQRPDNSLWPHLSLNDEGKMTISQKAFDNLKEEHCLYIKTEKGLALYEAHKAAVESLNNYISLCSKRFQQPGILKNFPLDASYKRVEMVVFNFDVMANDIQF